MGSFVRIAFAGAALVAAIVDGQAAAEEFVGDTSDGPIWNRPIVDGSGLTGDFVPYVALPFQVSVGGSYNFFAAPLGDSFDIVPFLYDATFEPATPLDGYLAAEDLFGVGGSETFNFTLATSTTYYAIVTGYAAFEYGPYSLTISGPGSVSEVFPGFAAGDFNEDTSVDGGDLLAWRQGFYQAGPKTHMQGDADGDMDTDGNDFLIWQRQLNVGGGATAVPEPTGLLAGLFAASGGWMMTKRGRGRRSMH